MNLDSIFSSPQDQEQPSLQLPAGGEQLPIHERAAERRRGKQQQRACAVATRVVITQYKGDGGSNLHEPSGCDGAIVGAVAGLRVMSTISEAGCGRPTWCGFQKSEAASTFKKPNGPISGQTQTSFPQAYAVGPHTVSRAPVPWHPLQRRPFSPRWTIYTPSTTTPRPARTSACREPP